jgi:hypothetical protein
MSGIELKKRHIFAFVVGFLMYAYLSDKFNKPDFKAKFKSKMASILGTSNSTHSALELFEGNQLAAVMSSTTTGALMALPVSNQNLPFYFSQFNFFILI